MDNDTGQVNEAIEDAAEGVSPGRSMRVAAALKAKGGDEFAKPGSIIEVKFIKGESLSLDRIAAVGADDPYSGRRCLGGSAASNAQGRHLSGSQGQ